MNDATAEGDNGRLQKDKNMIGCRSVFDQKEPSQTNYFKYVRMQTNVKEQQAIFSSK